MKSISSTIEQTDEEKVLEALVDQVPVGVCIIQDGKFCYANHYFVNATGYSLDELMDKDSFEIVVPEDREMVRENTISMLKGEVLSPYQFRVTCNNGSTIWVMATVKSIQYHGRQAVLGNYMEITGRKQAEDALKESESKFKSLAEHSPNMIFINRKGHIVYVNDECANATGYTREELYSPSFNFIDLISPKDRKRIQEMYRKHMKDEEVAPYEYSIITKDGELKAVISATKLVDYEGDSAILGVVTDITERRRAEEALQVEKNKLQAVVSAVEYGLTIQDRDYNIIYQNEASRIAYGGDHVGEKCYRIYASTEEVCPDCPVAMAIRDGKSHTVEKSGKVTPSGKVASWENTAYPIRDAKGEITSCLEVTRNVTERKRAEEALRQSEEKYRNLVENITDVIYAVDKNGVATYISPVVESCLGYRPSEITGRYFGEFIHQEDLARAMESFVSTLSGTATTDDYRCWTKSGDIRWMHASNQPILEGSRVVGAYGVLIDITERKQAEEALAQSQERYRTLTENAGEAILVVQDGVVKFINPKGEELSGYSAKELTSKPFVEFIYPDDSAMVADNYVRRLKGETLPQTYDFRIIRKDGEIRWGELNAVPISWDNEPAVLCFMSDITERKSTEEALRQSEDKYRTMLEEMEDSYFEVDLDGRLTFVNNSMCHNLGYSREELIGMSYERYTVEEDIESVYRAFHEVYRTGVPNTGFACKIIRKDGRQRSYETSVSVLRDSNGETIGFRGVGRDVTERSQMEEQLRNADRLASLGELASGIAHEINNPLTGIIGLSHLLKRKDLPKDIEEDIQLICSEAQRAANVVKGLLTFYRKHPPTRQTVNINEVTSKVLELRTYEQKVSNIETVINLAPDLPEIWGDFYQLQQVFLNIVANAEYFMLKARDKGTLTITTESVGDIIRISVADDGPGILGKDLAYIFDPFFTTKEVGQGTGLGLSISHGIVVAHGGHITAESKEGEGATFVVELPIRQKEGPGEK